MIDQKLNILIIEDTPTDAELIVHRLLKNDFSFVYHLVESAQKINQILENHSIDLVISDFKLPGFDGFEALRIVKNYDSTIPFILLSGNITQKQEITALQLGANDVIMKSDLRRLPFSVRKIIHEYENQKHLKLLESVVTNTNDAVIILEAEPDDMLERKIVYVNSAFNQITEYTKKKAIGIIRQFLNEAKTDIKKRQQLGEAVDQWKTFEVELLNYTKNKDEFWVNLCLIPVPDQKGGHSHWVCIQKNITDRKIREQELRQALEEKEVLLAEIHHRVKNNLAVVSSFLQLEQYQTDSSELQEVLQKTELRIKSIANIHEILYKSHNFSAISFKDYIEEILNSIEQAFNPDKRSITIKKDIADVILNVNQAIPLGLIVNELLTNIYKHAFAGSNDKSQVYIKIKEQNKKLALTISDNGSGLPEMSIYEEGKSLGFVLVKTFVSQLNAETNLLNEDGFTFQMEFLKNNHKGSASASNINF